MAFYKAPTQNYVATTLNGSIIDSVTTITLTDASRFQAPGKIVIDREDGNNTSTPNAREVVTYTGKSGNDLTGCTRGDEGSTARSHNTGALVEAVFTAGMWNDLRDAVTASLTTSGDGITLTGVASVATMNLITGNFTRFSVSSIASIARIELQALQLASVASIARGEFQALQAASVASIALPDNSVKSRQLTSGLYRTSNWIEFTTTSTTYVDATGVSVASVVLNTASDVEVCLQLEYTKNSTAGSSQNQYQLLYGATVIGSDIFFSIPSANQNYCLFIRKTVQNLAAGTYTFKLQAKNNAAGTLTVGIGEMTVKVRATGV